MVPRSCEMEHEVVELKSKKGCKTTAGPSRSIRESWETRGPATRPDWWVQDSTLLINTYSNNIFIEDKQLRLYQKHQQERMSQEG